ncbi:MAG: orotidine 5'-phosphate decarboxylase / HUMPS family protein, partial [Sciscionella sp.]
MDLQIALDRMPMASALDLVARISTRVDWIEAGTSMIKRYGCAGLIELVDAADPTPVLADLKTVDDAEFELGMVYD